MNSLSNPQHSFTFPIFTASEANISEHWAKRKKRKDLQKRWIKEIWDYKQPNITLPCIIKLTRIAKRELDSDNLQTAFKTLRDSIASKIIPGKKIGHADNDKRLKWEYEQIKGKSSVKIEII